MRGFPDGVCFNCGLPATHRSIGDNGEPGLFMCGDHTLLAIMAGWKWEPLVKQPTLEEKYAALEASAEAMADLLEKAPTHSEFRHSYQYEVDRCKECQWEKRKKAALAAYRALPIKTELKEK